MRRYNACYYAKFINGGDLMVSGSFADALPINTNRTREDSGFVIPKPREGLQRKSFLPCLFGAKRLFAAANGKPDGERTSIVCGEVRQHAQIISKKTRSNS